MSEPLTPSLPRGFKKIEGARASGVSFLCWSGHKAAAWSPGSGWNELPEAPVEISAGLPLPDGVLVVCADISRLGRWAMGGKDWSWWQESPRYGDGFGVSTVGGRVLLFGPPFDDTKVTLCTASAHDLQVVAERDDISINMLVGVTEARDGNGLNLVTSDEILYWSQPFESGTLSSRQLVLGSVFGATALPEPIGGALVVEQYSSPTTIIEPTKQSIGEVGLGGFGVSALWKARAADDRQTVQAILDALPWIPRSSDLMSESIYDLAVVERARVVSVGYDGLVVVDTAWECPSCSSLNTLSEGSCTSCHAERPPERTPPESLFESAAGQHSATILSWRLWLDHDRYLTEVLDALTQSLASSEDLLACAVEQSEGIDACRLAVERTREKPLDAMFFGSFDGCQALFRRFGTDASDICVEALDAEEPSVLAMACAVSGTLKDDQPVLWDEQHPAPAARLVELIEHPHPGVATRAAAACGALRLTASETAVARLLTSTDSTVRTKAAEALGRLPGLTDETQAVLARTAIRDADENVREAVVSALGGAGGSGSDHVDVLLQVLGDVDYSPRMEAAEALGELGGRMTHDRLLRVLDSVSLLLMAGRLAPDASDFTMGIDDVVEGVISGLVKDIDDPEDLGKLPRDRRELAADAIAAGVAQQLVFSEYQLDADDLESMNVAVETAGRPPILDSRDALEIARDPEKAAGFLAKLATSWSAAASDLARRMAVLACFAGRRTRHFLEVDDSDVLACAFVPLHMRLRSAGHAETPAQISRRMTRDLSTEPGVPGLSALYALAAGGDTDALEQLQQRALGEEGATWPAILNATLVLLDKDDKRSFVERVLRNDDIPVALRTAVAFEWDDEHDGPIPEDALDHLRRSTAQAGHLQWGERHGAALELADRGDTGPLEGLWQEREQNGGIPDDEQYSYGRDMVLCGHPEHMDMIRGDWIERGDLGALEAFKKHGTLDDIPELERALELKAPEQLITETIAAIRTRCEG